MVSKPKEDALYPFVTQRDIVVACFAIHNFIRKERLSDEFFLLYDHREVHDSSNLQDDNVVDEVQPYGRVKLEHEKIWMLLTITSFQLPDASSIIFALQAETIRMITSKIYSAHNHNFQTKAVNIDGLVAPWLDLETFPTSMISDGVHNISNENPPNLEL
ncbi:hypothetical protein Tco_1269583, partial [Tanacetum coccineum]